MGTLELTSQAIQVLQARYLWPGESAEQMFRRVARKVASVEKPNQRKRTEARFFDLMASLKFLPNSPTLMNAGRDRGQLSACFVLPLPDELEGILETLKRAALIHQSGGGTGFAFSRLRGAGERVGSTGGVAAGPVAYLRVFDSTTEVIKQGGVRRGANMGVLSVHHPDIESFIECKKDLRGISNFNLSVGITDEFLVALERGGDFALRAPQNGTAIGKRSAQRIWDLIIRSAWGSGDPGLVFLDRMNRFNPTPRVGAFESTNPCGEQPLLENESCNLGSVNLARYVRGRDLDWSALENDLIVATRFLDNVIECNWYPVRETHRATLKTRKIGLGVMGFADALLLLGVRYSSEAAILWGERIMSFVDRTAKAASHELAQERGAFPSWKGSLWEQLGYPKLRNATVSTVAPTGTISLIAGCSSGIEPIYAAVTRRNVLQENGLIEVNGAVREALRNVGAKEMAAHTDGWTQDSLSAQLGDAWCPVEQVSVEMHVKIQAAFQRHSDSAVSKTVNLPRSAPLQEAEHAFRLASRLGCKGITIYRDGSRQLQVLDSAVSPGPVCLDC